MQQGGRLHRGVTVPVICMYPVGYPAQVIVEVWVEGLRHARFSHMVTDVPTTPWALRGSDPQGAS